MKTGIELIAQERLEQIEKHGFTLDKYDQHYQRLELIQAALFCIDMAVPKRNGLRTYVMWPRNWDIEFKNKIIKKDKIGQLKVAAALLAAEIDRLQNTDK